MKNKIDMQKGLTLLEILVSMVVAGIGVAAFVQTTRPAITANKSNKGYEDLTGALAEILDSSMTQPVTTLDGMNGMIFKSRQGVNVKLAVASYSQAEADAILAGLDISRMRKLKVMAQSDTTKSLSGTVSNYQETVSGKCYTN